MRITEAIVTPIAFRDPPLLNVAGCHQPWALRSIIELRTEDGHVGLGESYGDTETLADLEAARTGLIGLSPFDLNGLKRAVLGKPDDGAPYPPKGGRRTAVAFGAFEVAMLDLQARQAGVPLHVLLGGAVRERVPYSAYLFYKFARHAEDPGYPTDNWGEALSHAQVVDQARRMVDSFGFTAIKLKAGVFEPDYEIETLRHLHAAFPDHPLRIDPNCGWTLATTKRILPAFTGLLEYLEDPVATLEESAEIQRLAPMPLATNMITTEWGHIPKTVKLDALRVVLTDHHYWGGLRATQQLAQMGRVHGWGISMHSNSHLGISLAAMTQVGATIPNLTYAADTHYPWQEDEVIQGGKLRIEGGSVALPTGPGLGVTLDRSALAALHDNYRRIDIRHRDDASEMRKHKPDWVRRQF